MKKKTFSIMIIAIVLLCSITMMKKSQANTEYEPSIEIEIKQGYLLSGKSAYTGFDVPVGVFVKKAVISSGAIAIFQKYHRSDDVTFSGVKDIAIYMKSGKVYQLWNDYKDKTISYDEQTEEAVTYILFSKEIPLNEMEFLEVAGEKFEINAQTNDESL